MTNETLNRLREQEKERARADNQRQIRNERLAEWLEQSVTREEVKSMISQSAEQTELHL